MISVWLGVEEYKDYVKGINAIAWAKKDVYQRINLTIPIVDVVEMEEFNDGSIEITIRKQD
jgi:hypothetical protein